MIAIREVTKVYAMGSVEVHALRGASLDVADGEWVAVMGPSGSGKSTLMNVIGCLDMPTSGSYRLNDTEISGLSEAHLAAVRNQQIGFVFQSFNLLPRISALRQVMLPLMYQPPGKRLSHAVRVQRARQMLETVGLADRVEHRPTELSGGEQQRVAIARALTQQPSILLADEPTGNLDSHSGAEVMEILGRLHRDQGLTIVMVTHDPTIAAWAQRTIHIQDGLVVPDGAHPASQAAQDGATA